MMCPNFICCAVCYLMWTIKSIPHTSSLNFKGNVLQIALSQPFKSDRRMSLTRLSVHHLNINKSLLLRFTTHVQMIPVVFYLFIFQKYAKCWPCFVLEVTNQSLSFSFFCSCKIKLKINKGILYFPFIMRDQSQIWSEVNVGYNF